MHFSWSKGTLAEFLPLPFELFQTGAAGSLKISSLTCSKVIGLTLGFFLMHCHSESWSLLQFFQEHDHQFSNDNAVHRRQDKLLGTKCYESATLSKWLHCPMYYSTVCYQSIWKTYRSICNHSQGTYTPLQTTSLQWVLVVPYLPSHELVGVKDWSGSRLLWTPPYFAQKCFIIDKRTPSFWSNWATSEICDSPHRGTFCVCKTLFSEWSNARMCALSKPMVTLFPSVILFRSITPEKYTNSQHA